MDRKNYSNIVNAIGIGIFGFLVIFELTGLLEYLFGQLLFIAMPGFLGILWLPELLGLVVFVILLLWAIKKVKTTTQIDSSKILVKTIMAFFAVLLVRALHSQFGTVMLWDSFPEAFDAFHRLRDENQVLQRIMALLPTLKYMIFAILLLSFRKTNV